MPSWLRPRGAVEGRGISTEVTGGGDVGVGTMGGGGWGTWAGGVGTEVIGGGL